MYGCQLLYQILEKLSERFEEKEIELILLVLKSVGFLLRKDDPVALKDLILKLQQKAAGSQSEKLVAATKKKQIFSYQMTIAVFLTLIFVREQQSTKN